MAGLASRIDSGIREGSWVEGSGEGVEERSVRTWLLEMVCHGNRNANLLESWVGAAAEQLFSCDRKGGGVVQFLGGSL